MTDLHSFDSSMYSVSDKLSYRNGFGATNEKRKTTSDWSLGQVMEQLLKELGAIVDTEFNKGKFVYSSVRPFPTLEKIELINDAVHRDSVVEVKNLLDAEDLALVQDGYGRSLLHKSVLQNSRRIAEWLGKKYPKSLNILDKDKRNCLHYAGVSPEPNVIFKFLLSLGADPNALDIYGKRPQEYLDQPDKFGKAGRVGQYLFLTQGSEGDEENYSPGFSDSYSSELTQLLEQQQKEGVVAEGLEWVDETKDLDSKTFSKDQNLNKMKEDLITILREDIIGENKVFLGPFGARKCIYLDDTASGRSLRSIENFILENVLPVYGNTHTTTSYFASQISSYRNEARGIVRRACGGIPDDVVIFCGSGATGAIQKLVQAVQKPGLLPPIVLIGPLEHHSNILPWREATKEIINLRQNIHGLIDMRYLEEVLKTVKSKEKTGRRLLIGAFSAASNVTGATTDDVAVTALMHKYGGLAFWDYAAAAPHVAIRMNPQTGDAELDKLARKDALYFSGHKFTGGPQTTGILVAKRTVFQNPVPHGLGGGTVLFVTQKKHQYLPEIHEREEGGTPAIIESIRLGLVCQVKDMVGISTIIEREWNYTREVLDAFAELPEIVVLGSKSLARVPIVSFMIKHIASGYFLHHDFVVALMNDLFGIQCRGGCMCAGPYAQSLLGISEELATMYENLLIEPREVPSPNEEPSYDVIFKPGFARLSLPYHASKEDIQFTIAAVKLIAKSGWEILPFYIYDPAKGTFRFGENPAMNEEVKNPIRSYTLGEQSETGKAETNSFQSSLYHRGCLQFAHGLISKSRLMAIMGQHEVDGGVEATFQTQRKPLRWFMIPSDVRETFKNRVVRSPSPFVPLDNYKSIPGTKNWNAASIPDQFLPSFLKKN